MIRYSYYPSTNYRTNLSAPTQLLSSLEKEYRELQDLREHVREVEAAVAKRYRELQDLRERVREVEAAAAKRLRPRVKLKTCGRPVSSRKPVTRNPEQFTKRQLYTMLAEAVRNTG